MKRARLPVLLAACALAAGTPAAAQVAPPRLVAFAPEQVEAATLLVEEVRYDVGESRPMSMIDDRYLLRVRTGTDTVAPVQLSVSLTSSPTQPYADRTEAGIRKEFESKKPYSSEALREAVQVDGAWFELSGFGPDGTGGHGDSLLYFGDSAGLGWSLHVSYDAKAIPTARVREVVESIRLEESRAAEIVAGYASFAATGATEQGLRSNFGNLAIPGAAKYKLKDLTGAGDGRLRLEYERGRAWLSLTCVPLDAMPGADRVALEKELFTGGRLSGLSAPETIGDAAAPVHAYRYQREALFGGSVPELAWTMARDGHLLVASARAPSKKDTNAIIAALQRDDARCAAFDSLP
jgi:hypothetical protein